MTPARTAAVLSVLALAGFADSAAAQRTVEIDPDTYGAIAYSVKTGKYGYAYGRGSRASAERTAVAECGADDAKAVAWVQFGWAAIAIADDNAYGIGVTHGRGASNTDARQEALDAVRKHTKMKVVKLVCISSSGHNTEVKTFK